MLRILDRTPDFLIIGAQKSGTSALHSYLSQHPQIKGSRRKEIGFFHQDKRYVRGPRWYAKQLPLRFREGTLLFEADPEYLYHPCAAERIFRFKPAMRLIILVRNPVERAFSAWNMLKQFHDQGRDSVAGIIREYVNDANPEAKYPALDLLNSAVFPDFHDCVLREIKLHLTDGHQAGVEPSFVRRGLYAAQVKRVFERFPRENVLVLEDKDLKSQRVETLNRVTRFLNVAEFDWNRADLKDEHARSYGQKMKEETRRILLEFFTPHNHQFYSLMDRQFNWQ